MKKVETDLGVDEQNGMMNKRNFSRVHTTEIFEDRLLQKSKHVGLRCPFGPSPCNP